MGVTGATGIGDANSVGGANSVGDATGLDGTNDLDDANRLDGALVVFMIVLIVVNICIELVPVKVNQFVCEK
jgi:hypothetical protein